MEGRMGGIPRDSAGRARMGRHARKLLERLGRMARLGQEGAHQADRLLRTEIMRLKKCLEIECREAFSSEVPGKLFADDGRRAGRDLAQGIEDELMGLVL